MSDTSKLERIEEFLRKSLLGDELINTQFHLFSAKSVAAGRVTKPRVLCANNVLLAKSSQYFLDLLSSDIDPSDPDSLIDITGDNDIPRNARINDYGYESDSDLDIDEDVLPLDTEAEKDQHTKQTREDDEVSDDGSESASSDMFVLSPEVPRSDEAFGTKERKNESIASSETAVEETRLGGKAASTTSNHASARLRFLGSRHIFVKDTAFQTWYSLLNYLYTGKFNFSPLSSASTGSQSNPSSTSPLDEPRCSAKSMYRLASKVGLDDLRDEAFSYIQSNLTEHNILQEISSKLVSRQPSLLEMELDALYSHIASPPVVAGFPALARRIANGELPHGADIVIGIHTRLLKTPRSSAVEPTLSRPSVVSLCSTPSEEPSKPPGPSAVQPSLVFSKSKSPPSPTAKPAAFTSGKPAPKAAPRPPLAPDPSYFGVPPVPKTNPTLFF